ncbi:hypothetical protein Tco_0700058, partial [Tanacetum coccineum]
MESIRNKFFIGADSVEKKITWVAWDKVLAWRFRCVKLLCFEPGVDAEMDLEICV